MRRINPLLAALAVPLALASNTLRAADALPLTELAKPGRVLMLRHALAPGTGDPPGFRLRECATQRNLSADGRAQAVEIGKLLARAGITRPKIYSSQWCRCLETARLLDVGPVEELPALNNLFGRPQNRAPQVDTLRALLAELPPDGPPVIWVTHGSTILALIGRYAASGGGVVLALNGTREPRVLGDIEVN
jgi:phosphohistidine phosphatase SixA